MLGPPLFLTILFISFFILIFIGIPIAIALGLASILVIIIDPSLNLLIFFQRSLNSLNSFVLLAVPLFLLTGNIMNKSDITKHLIRMSQSLVGHIAGGLAYVNIIASMFFAGISGSSNADAAGIGSVLIPAMKDEGYSSSFSVAVTAVSAVMGNIIPPSLLMVVWSSVTETSVAAMFIGGILPGIMIGLGQMSVVWIMSKKYNFPRQAKFSINEFAKQTKHGIIALGTPVLIIGGIVLGYFTPTEAAAVSIIYSLFVCLIFYKGFSWSKFLDACSETAKITALALFCLAMASIFGWLISYYRLPRMFVNLINIQNPSMLLIFICIIMIIMGTFMDALAIMVIVGPLFLPLISQAGIHPIHFGIVSIFALALGFVTPPYGICLLISSKIGNIPITKALKDVVPFFIVMIIILLLIIFIPELVMFIPKLLVPKFL